MIPGRGRAGPTRTADPRTSMARSGDVGGAWGVAYNPGANRRWNHSGRERMTIDRRVLRGAFATALLVAACGGSASPAPSAAASAASQPAASAPAASQPAASEPAATDQPSATDNGSAPNVSLSPGSAPELEAMLPSTVNGVAFGRTSFGGAAMPAGIPIGSGDLATFLQQNGKTLADVNIAMATPTDAAKAATFVMAFQIKGVDGAKLADALD